MGYPHRKASALDIYHVIQRGAGKQILFEDDEDREMYLACIDALLETMPVEMYAWCLMGNHIHLVLHSEQQALSTFMRDLGRHYSQYFNHEHGRVGHLFQGRYKSVPIADEAQLLSVVRYVHRNPVEAGVSDLQSYRWSSFPEYLGKPKLTTTDTVLGCFGGIPEFNRFHSEGDVGGGRNPLTSSSVFRLNDDEALQVLKNTLLNNDLARLPVDDKATRNRILVELKCKGLSVRQIARLTGVGVGIVARA